MKYDANNYGVLMFEIYIGNKYNSEVWTVTAIALSSSMNLAFIVATDKPKLTVKHCTLST